MSKSLPMTGFKWLDPENIDKYDYISSRDCILEVNLGYPKELYKLHNDYPLAPNKLEIEKEMISDYQLKIADDYIISNRNVKKLVSNFFSKEKYFLHNKN